jgi:PAS domain-containing protein
MVGVMDLGPRDRALFALSQAVLVGLIVGLGSWLVELLLPGDAWIDNVVAGIIACGLTYWIILLQVQRNRDRVLFQHYARNRLQAISLLVHGFDIEPQVRSELDLLARDLEQLRPFREDSPSTHAARAHQPTPWTFDEAAHRALDSMESVVMCDANGVLRYFNDATRKLHGLPQLDIPAEQWPEYYQLYDAGNRQLLAPADVPLFRALRGEVVDRVPIVIRRRSGGSTRVEVSGCALRDNHGRAIGAMVIQVPVEQLTEDYPATPQVSMPHGRSDQAARSPNTIEKLKRRAKAAVTSNVA